MPLSQHWRSKPARQWKGLELGYHSNLNLQGAKDKCPALLKMPFEKRPDR
jgi:hypothetical protein